MISAPKPIAESARLNALASYRILDTSPEECFDDFTKLASRICETPISLISLIDKERQWFKSRVGLEAPETHRNLAFCAHAILDCDNLLEVPNACEDERFFDNPLVVGDPRIRFYAGTPLVNGEGFGLGTLCVIDREPRRLSETQKTSLAMLGRRVVAQLELKKVTFSLAEALESIRVMEGLLSICAHCKNIRDDNGSWIRIEEHVRRHSEAQLTHGICPSCIRAHFPEQADAVEAMMRERSEAA